MNSLFYSTETKAFNVPYHPGIAERIEQISKKHGRFNKTALLKRVLDLYFEDYKLGKVKPSKIIRRAEKGNKPRFSASIDTSYLETFNQITQSLKDEVKNDPQQPKKAITYTKSKVLEEILMYWLEKEGIQYE